MELCFETDVHVHHIYSMTQHIGQRSFCRWQPIKHKVPMTKSCRVSLHTIYLWVHVCMSMGRRLSQNSSFGRPFQKGLYSGNIDRPYSMWGKRSCPSRQCLLNINQYWLYTDRHLLNIDRHLLNIDWCLLKSTPISINCYLVNIDRYLVNIDQHLPNINQYLVNIDRHW